MGATRGNTNAKKKRTRISAHLSLADEKGRERLSWATRQAQRGLGIPNPTDDEVRRYMLDWLYALIDAEMRKEEMEPC